MLVRASTLKIIRLQLAMERRDQRVALEAVDDLVALDRSLEQFLSHYPKEHEDGLLGNVLELERSALNVEKHTLAAGFTNGGRSAGVPTLLGEPDESAGLPVEESYPYESEPYEFRMRFRILSISILILAALCASYALGASGVLSRLL